MVLHVVLTPMKSWTLIGRELINSVTCLKYLTKLVSEKMLILGLHCHAMKNTNANHSIQKD